MLQEEIVSTDMCTESAVRAGARSISLLRRRLGESDTVEWDSLAAMYVN